LGEKKRKTFSNCDGVIDHQKRRGAKSESLCWITWLRRQGKDSRELDNKRRESNKRIYSNGHVCVCV